MPPIIHRIKIPRVKVALPFYRDVPPPLQHLCEHLVQTGIPGYDVYLAKQSGTVIEIARNELIQYPLGIDYDFLFFIDDDVGFDGKDAFTPEKHTGLPMIVYYMKKILDHDLNICGGVYHQKKPPYLPVVYRQCRMKDGKPIERMTNVCLMDGSVMEVDGLGGGFLCIKSKVLKAFANEFERKEKCVKKFWALGQERIEKELAKLSPTVQEYFKICKPDISPPFKIDFVYDESSDRWSHRGEDIYFSLEAKKLGFKIYCDTSVRLGHLTQRYITPEHFEINFREEVIKLRHDEFEKNGIADPEYDELMKLERDNGDNAGINYADDCKIAANQ